MRVSQFHTVDLDENEVVHIFGMNCSIKLRDDLSNSGCLSCAWRARNINTSTSSFHNCCTQMIIHCVELCLSAWKGIRDRRYVEQSTRLAIWRGEVSRREDTSAQWCEFQGLFNNDSIDMCQCAYYPTYMPELSTFYESGL